jgi:uncharacterized repeat protein (TIGR03847 family)
MSGTVYEFNPVTHITTGFIGQPGKRVFYLQASREAETVTLIVEKLQVEALAQGITEFVKELQEKIPDLPTLATPYRAEQMSLRVPLDPAFRVGQLALGYDQDRDLVVLVAQEVVTEERTADDASVARLYATRAQMLALSEHGKAVVQKGRALCPFCGQPIDPEGHFCPKRNGHRY